MGGGAEEWGWGQERATRGKQVFGGLWPVSFFHFLLDDVSHPAPCHLGVRGKLLGGVLMLARKAGEVAGRGVGGHQETFTDPSGELPGAG